MRRLKIQRETDGDGICTLTFDRPESGANIFDAATMDSLREHLDAIENDGAIKGVIVTSAKKSIFIAGADLQTLLRQAQTGELRAFIADGQRFSIGSPRSRFRRWRRFMARARAAAMRSRWRAIIAWRANEPATRIGLPETTLGLVPAWGGATRLPRLIGLDAAAEVITKGKLYAADEALEAWVWWMKWWRASSCSTPRGSCWRRANASRLRRRMSASEVKLPRADQSAAAARAFEIINRAPEISIEESLADGIGRDRASSARPRRRRTLIRNFFLGDKYRKGSSKSAGGKNHARGGGRLRRDGLGHRAVAELAWRRR